MMEQFYKEYKKIIEIVSNRYLDGVQFQKDNLEKVYDILSDKESKQLFKNEIMMLELNNFLKGDLPQQYSNLMTWTEWNIYQEETRNKNFFPDICCPNNDSAKNILNYCKTTTFLLEQYSYKNIVNIEKDDICIDTGACLGDTSLYFIKKGAKVSYAFEIDNDLIKCMHNTFNNYKYNIKIINKALSNKNGKFYYKPNPWNIGNGTISHEPFQNTSPENYYMVEATTLDEFCNDNKIAPNFIKMDIEGAEPDALKGAIETLKKYRPKFAVCIYHKWEHRWEIPILLNNFLENYNFYMKKSHPFCETVFFGIAQEKIKTSIPDK